MSEQVPLGFLKESLLAFNIFNFRNGVKIMTKVFPIVFMKNTYLFIYLFIILSLYYLIHLLTMQCAKCTLNTK